MIRDLDLHVDEGEIVSVIGPNGAGKTTLFNLITGVYRPDAGDIRFDGESIVGLRAAQDHEPRHRPHVPEPAAVPEHDRERERDGGRVRAHAAPASVASILRHAAGLRREEKEIARSPRSGSPSSGSG